MRAIIERRAVEGCSSDEGGVLFHHATGPRVFHKNHVGGPTLTVIAQGKKVARLGDLEVTFDPRLASS
jgi:hypothetical protein